jgi:hypothetical protein
METSEFYSLSGAELINRFDYRECPKPCAPSASLR